MTGRTRVLFVNSGILGQSTFSKFVREAMTFEAAALRKLIESPDLRHRLGRAAREQVLRDAHPDDYRRRLAGIIRTAADRPAVSRVA